LILFYGTAGGISRLRARPKGFALWKPTAFEKAGKTFNLRSAPVVGKGSDPMSKDKVYELLRASPETFHSGEELSRRLGVSRAAVWKAIDSLRRDGYVIEARNGLGYRLTSSPDALVEREIRRRLSVPCPDLRCLEEIDSTNSYLKREALAGAPHGTVAIANGQTAGRGRLTRTFQSPPGKGVYLSILLRPHLPPSELLGLTGMTAVAVCNAVERTAGVRPGIKWTNDLVLNGRKICGILTEMALETESGSTQYVVIGVGVNVSHTPEDFGPEVSQMAASLAQEGHPVSRPALAAAMIEELFKLSDALGGDMTDWVDAYRRDCVNIGKPVRLMWTDRQARGQALDIDSQFGLVVRMEDGSVTTVRTGEVSVRGLYGYTE